MQDGQRVFGASASFVAFEGVGVSDAELRENKIGIDLERSTIVDQRVIKLARHAHLPQHTVDLVRLRAHIFDEQQLLLKARISQVLGFQTCLISLGKIAENVVNQLLVVAGFSHLFCLLLIVAEQVILSPCHSITQCLSAPWHCDGCNPQHSPRA